MILTLIIWLVFAIIDYLIFAADDDALKDFEIIKDLPDIVLRILFGPIHLFYKLYEAL